MPSLSIEDSIDMCLGVTDRLPSLFLATTAAIVAAVDDVAVSVWISDVVLIDNIGVASASQGLDAGVAAADGGVVVVGKHC